MSAPTNRFRGRVLMYDEPVAAIDVVAARISTFETRAVARQEITCPNESTNGLPHVWQNKPEHNISFWETNPARSSSRKSPLFFPCIISGRGKRICNVLNGHTVWQNEPKHAYERFSLTERTRAR